MLGDLLGYHGNTKDKTDVILTLRAVVVRKPDLTEEDFEAFDPDRAPGAGKPFEPPTQKGTLNVPMNAVPEAAPRPPAPAAVPPTAPAPAPAAVPAPGAAPAPAPAAGMPAGHIERHGGHASAARGGGGRGGRSGRAGGGRRDRGGGGPERPERSRPPRRPPKPPTWSSS